MSGHPWLSLQCHSELGPLNISEKGTKLNAEDFLSTLKLRIISAL